jgi:hypothetical protein
MIQPSQQGVFLFPFPITGNLKTKPSWLSSHLSCQISSQSSPQNYSPWNTNISLLSSGIGHSTWSSLQNSKPWPSWDSQHGPGLELLVSALTSTWPMPIPSSYCLLQSATLLPLRPQGQSLQHHRHPPHAFALCLACHPLHSNDLFNGTPCQAMSWS